MVSETLSHGSDLGDSYRELGKTCGLSYQIDFFGPLVADAKAHPERHVTMDVTTRDMKREYDRLVQTDAAFAAAARKREAERNASGDTDGDSGIVSWFIERQRAGDAGQAALAGTLCRGLMTFVMQRSAAGGGAGELDPVVLAFRNERLVAQLLADPRDKIYVTYGAAHIPGVLQRLRSHPGWTVQSVKWMRTISAPEHVDGGRL